MTIAELFNELEDKARDTFIVTLKYKYDFEEGGSIRRNKRNEREKNRNSRTGSTLYIDDIYDIVSGKNDQ